MDSHEGGRWVLSLRCFEQMQARVRAQESRMQVEVMELRSPYGLAMA